MQSLEHQRVVITGGSRGLGLGVVEALVARRAEVVVVARDADRLAALERRLGVTVISGDITERALADKVVREISPNVVILNAGAPPAMAPLHEQTWESFTAIWDHDVRAGFHWIQAALRTPLGRGGRVLITSSGAAVAGSPLSGGLAGAKRMLWLMAKYANGVAAELDLGVRFQALVPLQIIGDTEHGRIAAGAYARKKGIAVEAFLAGFGRSMPPRQYGEHVVAILTDPAYDSAGALGMKGDTGIQILEG